MESLINTKEVRFFEMLTSMCGKFFEMHKSTILRFFVIFKKLIQ